MARETGHLRSSPSVAVWPRCVSVGRWGSEWVTVQQQRCCWSDPPSPSSHEHFCAPGTVQDSGDSCWTKESHPLLSRGQSSPTGSRQPGQPPKWSYSRPGPCGEQADTHVPRLVWGTRADCPEEVGCEPRAEGCVGPGGGKCGHAGTRGYHARRRSALCEEPTLPYAFPHSGRKRPERLLQFNPPVFRSVSRFIRTCVIQPAWQ